jgi:hypothetical protein
MFINVHASPQLTFSSDYFCNMTKGLILLAIGCFSCVLLAQDYKSVDYNFHPPLKIPLVLAANFGELRTNHFHTGIDFKTDRKIGYNIYSIDDGYISRVKVSPWGYGMVVYVDHYNGLTSVYAHCSAFKGGLADLVADRQRKEQNFAIEYYPPKDSLKVKRGEVIALSGNTGGSTAPHLHFEIRETKTEHAINPLLFKFAIEDTRKPIIRGIKVYALTAEGYRIPNRAKVVSVTGSDGKYAIVGNMISIPANYATKDGGVGLAFDAVDQLNAADNICGIFEAFLILNGDTIYRQNMARIDFETNRQINTHKDYEEFHMRKKHYQKTFKTIHNPLPIYRQLKNNGILKLAPGTENDIEYVCKDVHGNVSRLSFKLVVQEGDPGVSQDFYTPGKPYLFPDSVFAHRGKDEVILFPPGLLYEPTERTLKTNGVLDFGNSRVPLQTNYKVMLKLPNTSLEMEKFIVKRVSHTGSTTTNKGAIHEGWISIETRDFGKFSVAIDTIAPTIVKSNVIDGTNVRGKELWWSFSDDLSGVEDYDIFIDDEWHLLSYEPKDRKFYFTHNPQLVGKKNVLIRVEDACGNVLEKRYELVF